MQHAGFISACHTSYKLLARSLIMHQCDTATNAQAVHICECAICMPCACAFDNDDAYQYIVLAGSALSITVESAVDTGQRCARAGRGGERDGDAYHHGPVAGGAQRAQPGDGRPRVPHPHQAGLPAAGQVLRPGRRRHAARARPSSPPLVCWSCAGFPLSHAVLVTRHSSGFAFAAGRARSAACKPYLSLQMSVPMLCG